MYDESGEDTQRKGPAPCCKSTVGIQWPDDAVMIRIKVFHVLLYNLTAVSNSYEWLALKNVQSGLYAIQPSDSE